MNKFGMEITDELLKDFGLTFTVADWEAADNYQPPDEIVDSLGSLKDSLVTGMYRSAFYDALRNQPRYRFYELKWGLVGDHRISRDFWLKCWEKDNNTTADPNRYMVYT